MASSKLRCVCKRRGTVCICCILLSPCHSDRAQAIRTVIYINVSLGQNTLKRCYNLLGWFHHRGRCCRTRYSHTINYIVSNNIGLRADERARSEEHTSELQSRENLVCRLLLEKKKEDNRQAWKPHDQRI